MTQAEFNNYVDGLFPSGQPEAINSANLRAAVKTVGLQLRQDAALITAWSPVLVPVVNGPYVAMKIADWINGQGTKPAVGQYLSLSGMTADITLAQDFRGAVGNQGLPGTGIMNAATSPADGFGGLRYYPIMELIAGSGATYDFADIEITGKPWDNTSGGHGHMNLYIANRGTFKYEYMTQGVVDGWGVVVLRLADGRAVAYLKSDNGFRGFGVRVTNYIQGQATVYGGLSPITALPSGGTVLLDTTNAANYPPIMSIGAGTSGGDLFNINSVILGNNTSARKVVLYNVAGNDHQFYGQGVLANQLRYQVPTPDASHIFSAGVTAGSSAEIMRMQGNGNVGIGHTTPDYRLSVGASNPAGGVVAQIINYANGTQAGATGAFHQVHQGGVAIWRHGIPAGVSAYGFYAYGGGAYPEVARFTEDKRLFVGQTTGTDRDLVQVNGSISGKAYSQSANPGSGEVPSGYFRLVKNTGNGEVRLWYNDGGTMKSALLS